MIQQYFILAFIFEHVLGGFPPGSVIQEISGYTLLEKGKFGSALYQIDIPNSSYEYPPLLVDLRASDSYT